MDSKELRGLMEAYSKVYVSQEETIIDEGKSSRPRYSGPERVGLGPEGSERRTEKRSAHAEYRRGHTEGPGTVTKNPKKLRKQKAMGELGGSGKAEVEEGYLDIFDVVLEFLQVEGYAETLEEAEWMMANLIDEEAVDIILGEALTGERYKKVMKKPGGTAYSRRVSADPAKRATRGGKGGESDFGAGDRGSGNRAARRAGTYQEEEFAIDEGAAGDVAARAQKLANQRKGQTPERKKMYQGLADKAAARERGPFKGGTSRQGMTPSERTRSREAAAYQADVHGGSATYGKGSLPKGKKLERQRARGVSERFESWLDEAMTNYEKNRKRAAQRAAARNAARDQGKTGAVPGVGYVTPRRESEYWTDESGKKRHAKGL